MAATDSTGSGNPASKDPTAAAIARWFETLAACVDRVDYGTAAALFDDAIANFSTASTWLRGKETFREKQWRKVWPTIENFRFDADALEWGAAADGTMAWGATTWQSTGIAKDGSTFPRPGRATVIFRRQTPDAQLLAIHIHFSLVPGTPEKSFGKKPETF